MRIQDSIFGLGKHEHVFWDFEKGSFSQQSKANYNYSDPKYKPLENRIAQF
jgi:hypothetical protein